MSDDLPRLDVFPLTRTRKVLAAVDGLIHQARELADLSAPEDGDRQARAVASIAAEILGDVAPYLLNAVSADDDRERGSDDQTDLEPVSVLRLADAGREEAASLLRAVAGRDGVETLALDGEGLGAVGDAESHGNSLSVERDELVTRAAGRSSDAGASGDIPTVGVGADSRAGAPFPAPDGAAASAGSTGAVGLAEAELDRAGSADER